ncbi:MAG: hypothetical protein QXF12_07050 [Candidatus Aenigmatarchaeota archaeon]
MENLEEAEVDVSNIKNKYVYYSFISKYDPIIKDSIVATEIARCRSYDYIKNNFYEECKKLNIYDLSRKINNIRFLEEINVTPVIYTSVFIDNVFNIRKIKNNVNNKKQSSVFYVSLANSVRIKENLIKSLFEYQEDDKNMYIKGVNVNIYDGDGILNAKALLKDNITIPLSNLNNKNLIDVNLSYKKGFNRIRLQIIIKERRI